MYLIFLHWQPKCFMTHFQIKICKIHVQYNGVCVCVCFQVCPLWKLRPCCTLAHVIHNTLRPKCWDMRIVTFSFNLLWLLSAICRQIIRGIQIYALKSFGVSLGKACPNISPIATDYNRPCLYPSQQTCASGVGETLEQLSMLARLA